MKQILPTLLALILLIPGTAEARKVALIIGNSTYANTSALGNPPNDIKIVADSARTAGFDDVTVAADLSVNEFQLAMRQFRAKANGADVAMVYYAGHGIEAQGANWLIPIDAELKTDLDLPYEAINLNRVMESLSGAQIRIVVLDACRNNPYGQNWRSGTRAVKQGMASVEADDVLVIFAAAPGQTAADGIGTNSPFAVSLAKRLPQPDLPVQLLGGAIRDDVLAATGGNQRPFVSASITGTPVYLVPRTAPVASAPVQPSGNRDAAEEFLWQGALAANNVRGFSAYLSEFPTGKFASQAGDKLTLLLKGPATPTGDQAVAASAPGPDAMPSPKRQYRLTGLQITCVKTTSALGIGLRLGLPDQLFLRFNTGERFPAGKRDIHDVKKGETWVVEEDFTFSELASFQVKEFDDIGGSDLIGTVELGEVPGTFTKLLDGDGGEYRVTYTLAVT